MIFSESFSKRIRNSWTSRVHASTSLTAQTSKQRITLRCFSPRLFSHDTNLRVHSRWLHWFCSTTFPAVAGGKYQYPWCQTCARFCYHLLLDLLPLRSGNILPHFKIRLPLLVTPLASIISAFALYRVIHTRSPFLIWNKRCLLLSKVWITSLAETKVWEGWNELFTGSQSIKFAFCENHQNGYSVNVFHPKHL